MNLTVIKLGGSLMGSDELPSWLKAIEIASKHSTIIIVPGGGEFANSIRTLQSNYQYTDQTAHNMALLSMCQFACLLKEINPNLKTVTNPEDYKFRASHESPLLWLPLNIIDEQCDIKPNWDFTSDSIALWLAIRLSADRLILVKSKALNSDRKSITNHIKVGDIDKGFQTLIGNYSGEILLLNKTESNMLM